MCNTNSAPSSGINASNAAKLTMLWKYPAAGDVPETPAVVGGFVYFGDEGGNFQKLDAKTGAMIWQVSVATVTGGQFGIITLPSAWSRTTPIVTADSVIFGTMLSGTNEVTGNAKAGFVVSLSPTDGSVNWVSKVLEPNAPASDIQQSPVYDGTGIIYLGTTSSEEAMSSYSFIGSIAAVDASKAGMGKILWQTPMIDSSVSGCFGASVWGSTPVVDKKRGLLYIGTGNNYQCGTPSAKGNHADSVVALELATGAIKWSNYLAPNGADIWTFNIANGAPDEDFSSGINFFTVNINGVATDLVGAGQKSGMYYAFNPDTGAVVWKKQFGPGGHVGGIHWGTATDGVRIYAGCNNTRSTSWTLPGGKTTTNGFWGAMNAATGDIIWQTANPNTGMTSNVAGGGQVTVNGPVRVANGVLFGGSMDNAGTMYAFDAATGAILWHFASGGSVYGGPAISGKSVFWGSGYASSLGFGTSSKTLYAFSVP